MMNWFKNCKCAEDVKKAYYNFTKKLHPDNGGDAAEFIKMRNEYKKAWSLYKDIHQKADGTTWEQTKEEEKATNEMADRFADIIDKIIFYQGIKIDVCGCFVWVSGNTYDYKDNLKENGFRYSGDKKCWYFTDKKYHKRSKRKVSFDEIKSMYGDEEVETSNKVFA